MHSVSIGYGGNKPLYDLFKKLNLHDKSLQEKYNSKVAKYYLRRHEAILEGRKFDEESPSKDMKKKLSKKKEELKDAKKARYF